MNHVKGSMTRAIRGLRAGRKEEAYRLFSEVVDLDPTNEDALLGKAGCSSDLDETILLLQKILAINPSNERAREGLEWAIERKRTVSETPAGAVVEQEERASSVVPEAVREETEEVERKQRRADTSTKVARVLVVLYGVYGFFNGVRLWVDKVTWLAAFGPPHTERSLSGLLSEVAGSVVIWVIMGFLFVLIAKSSLDSTQRKLRRLDVKRAGSAVPLILLFLSAVMGALSGVQYWVTSSLAMSQTPSGNLLALVFDIVGDIALFGGILFVGAMMVWWVVVALWSRFHV